MNQPKRLSGRQRHSQIVSHQTKEKFTKQLQQYQQELTLSGDSGYTQQFAAIKTAMHKDSQQALIEAMCIISDTKQAERLSVAAAQEAVNQWSWWRRWFATSPLLLAMYVSLTHYKAAMVHFTVAQYEHSQQCRALAETIWSQHQNKSAKSDDEKEFDKLIAQDRSITRINTLIAAEGVGYVARTATQQSTATMLRLVQDNLHALDAINKLDSGRYSIKIKQVIDDVAKMLGNSPTFFYDNDSPPNLSKMQDWEKKVAAIENGLNRHEQAEEVNHFIFMLWLLPPIDRREKYAMTLFSKFIKDIDTAEKILRTILHLYHNQSHQGAVTKVNKRETIACMRGISKLSEINDAESRMKGYVIEDIKSLFEHYNKHYTTRFWYRNVWNNAVQSIEDQMRAFPFMSQDKLSLKTSTDIETPQLMNLLIGIEDLLYHSSQLTGWRMKRLVNFNHFLEFASDYYTGNLSEEKKHLRGMRDHVGFSLLPNPLKRKVINLKNDISKKMHTLSTVRRLLTQEPGQIPRLLLDVAQQNHNTDKHWTQQTYSHFIGGRMPAQSNDTNIEAEKERKNNPTLGRK